MNESERKAFSLVRLSLIVLLIAFFGFFVWAAWAPLDQGASAQGLVTVSNYRKPVQHPYGGVVKEILVRDGEEVKKDQVLLRLEDTELRAQLAQVESEYFSALAIQSRLKAEREGLSYIVYPPELFSVKSSPEVQKVMQVQEEYFRARRAKLEAEKRVLLEAISGLRSYAKTLGEQLVHLRGMLATVKTQIESLSPLAEEGYFPRNRLLELKRQEEALWAQILETQANLQRATFQAQENEMRLKALEREFQREVEQEMAEVQKKLLALKETYLAIKDKLDKTALRAPEDGMVMNLRVHTLGAVLRPAEPILEIVPKDAELIVEAKLSPAHIENVKPGLPVDLHFIAIDPRKTPVLTGTLIYVSPDVQYEEVHGQKVPFYLLRVKIEPESFQKIKELNKEITAGMPVQVIVKTGKRTFLSYLLKPFLDRLATAFLK